MGVTHYNGVGLGSSVYLYPGLFVNKYTLFLGLQHEYIHAAFFAGRFGQLAITASENVQHGSIHMFQMDETKYWIQEGFDEKFWFKGYNEELFKDAIYNLNFKYQNLNGIDFKDIRTILK